MSEIRTMKGRKLNMADLAKKNEHVRAVGNAGMNARGDRLDSEGNVIATVQDVSRMQQSYMEPAETVSMGDAIPEKKTGTSEKSKNAKKKSDNPVKSRTEKTRSDGTKYVEIEYEDGSMETKEIDS